MMITATLLLKLELATAHIGEQISELVEIVSYPKLLEEGCSLAQLSH